MFLLNQNNRANWITKFKCPADTAMHGALLSTKTYYKVLNDLQDFGLIEVEKGINNFKAPKICIKKLKYSDENDYTQTPEIQIPESSSMVKIPIQLTELLTKLPTRLLTELTTELTTVLTTSKDILNTKRHLTLRLKDNKTDVFLNTDFVSENYKPIFQRWIDFKKSRGETYKNSDSLQTFYKKLLRYSNNDIERAIIIIENSIANNWAGIYEMKEQDFKDEKLKRLKENCNGTTYKDMEVKQ
jgi:hypothetical protein